ncbi:MAG: hypothetical protein WBB67_00335 [bacterium]
MKKLISLLFILSISSAQQKWIRTYGGADLDEGRMVQQTTDGGYIVIGFTLSFGAGDYDFYLIKTNASGDTLWTKTYGTARDDRASSIQQTTDGGYIVSGFSLPADDSLGDIYTIKINDQGDTLWSKRYAGANHHAGYPAIQTADGGYIISGSTYSYGAGGLDIYLIKTNSQGDSLWTRTYGGVNDETGLVLPDIDGGYIVCGQTCSFGDTLGDVYLVKTDSLGIPVWTKTYGGVNYDVGYGGWTSDGGYILGGYTCSFGDTLGDVYLIKTNSQGDTLWTRTYGGVGSDMGFPQQRLDGGYIIVGTTYSFGTGNADVYLIKTNASGDTLWTRTYGGTNNDFGWVLQQTTDGGYIVSGTTLSFGAGMEDFYLIKTDADGNAGVEESSGQDLRVRLKVMPNPFTSFARIPGYERENFVVYDVMGRKVGIYSGNRIGGELTPGVYFVRGLDTVSAPARFVKVRY